MTASLNKERCRLRVPEVGKKEELEEAVKEPLPQHWEEQDSVDEVVKTEWWSVKNSCNSSSAAKELEEGEVSAILGSSCETSVEPVWRRQWEEGSEEDDKEESERPEQRLLLNVPILARHSSTDIMMNPKYSTHRRRKTVSLLWKDGMRNGIYVLRHKMFRAC